MGSRYGGLKQMDGIGPGGQTLLEYSLYDARKAGFTHAVFIIRKDLEATFREVVLARFENVLPCTCVYQELDALPEGFTPPEGRTKPWGTGHAVLMAKDAVQGPFAVINADDFYGREAFADLANFLKDRDCAQAAYALCGYRLHRTVSAHGSVSRGLCLSAEDGRLLSVTEHTQIERQVGGQLISQQVDGPVPLSGDELVSMNLWGFTPPLFAQLESRFREFLEARGTELKSEFYLPFAVDEALQKGEASAIVLPTESQWFGVTYPDDRPIVSQAIQRLVDDGTYPGKLWG